MTTGNNLELRCQVSARLPVFCSMDPALPETGNPMPTTTLLKTVRLLLVINDQSIMDCQNFETNFRTSSYSTAKDRRIS